MSCLFLYVAFNAHMIALKNAYMDLKNPNGKCLTQTGGKPR